MVRILTMDGRTGLMKRFYVVGFTYMIPIRIFIVCCALISLVQSVFYCYRIFSYDKIPVKVLNVTQYVLPISQVIMALIFFIYGVYFIRKTQTHLSNDTQRMLARLSILGIFGFISFLGKAVSNILGSTDEIRRNLAMYLSAYLINDIVSVLRSICVILVLGIKTPRRTEGPGGGKLASIGSVFTFLQTSRFWSSIRGGTSTKDTQGGLSTLGGGLGTTGMEKASSKGTSVVAIDSLEANSVIHSETPSLHAVETKKEKEK